MADFGIKRIRCPYCLALNIGSVGEVTKCLKCKHDFPLAYIEDYDKLVPYFTQIIGWSNVGKTVFFQAITAMLTATISLWKKPYSFSAQTGETEKFARGADNFLKYGVRPPGTTVETTYIALMKGLERWGNIALIIRDVAGETFSKEDQLLDFPHEHMPYLKDVPLALMMFSLDDLENNESQKSFSMHGLLNGYIQTMFKRNRKFRDSTHTIVITLSKADLILDHFPINVQSYYQTDPFREALVSTKGASTFDKNQLSAYLQEMTEVSDTIRLWMDQTSRGRNLLSLARDHNIELRFTVISSTGRMVKENDHLPMFPTRVMDPLFWILESPNVITPPSTHKFDPNTMLNNLFDFSWFRTK
jgi:hypothetical protein